MERTLYDNHDINYTETYEDFKEWCKLNNVDYTQYDDESEFFFNWISDELLFEWEDFIYNLKNSNENVECVVRGYCGRWNGNFEIVPTEFTNVKDAIYACIQNCDYYIIKDIDGVIDIISIHHDASNHFTIEKKNGKFDIQF